MDEHGIARRVVRVDPSDVFGPSSGPLEQHAREMARDTPFSFEEIRLAIFRVNERRRTLGLPDIPVVDWIAIIRPGAQFAAVTSSRPGSSALIDAYWCITQACREAWEEPSPAAGPDWAALQRQLAAPATRAESCERRPFTAGLRRRWWER